MRLPKLFLLLLVIVIFIVYALSQTEPKDTASLLKDADEAFRQDKDYYKAILSFQAVLDGIGENKPTDQQIRRASLGLIRSKIYNKDFQEALVYIKRLDKEVLSLFNYCTLAGDLLMNNANLEAIEVLEITGKQFPNKKDALNRETERIRNPDSSNKAIDTLKCIPYL